MSTPTNNKSLYREQALEAKNRAEWLCDYLTNKWSMVEELPVIVSIVERDQLGDARFSYSVTLEYPKERFPGGMNPLSSIVGSLGEVFALNLVDTLRADGYEAKDSDFAVSVYEKPSSFNLFFDVVMLKTPTKSKKRDSDDLYSLVTKYRI